MPIIPHITPFADIVARHEPVFKVPLSDSFFTLDSSGVAGFFGGDGAVNAMATVHLLPYRSWGGWYNSPGAYKIAKQYGQLANSRLWDGLFPGPKCDPAEFFGLDGKPGPTFFGAHSGTRFERTGHLAYLIARKVLDLPEEEVVDLTVDARLSKAVHVTVIDLCDVPPYNIPPNPNTSPTVKSPGPNGTSWTPPCNSRSSEPPLTTMPLDNKHHYWGMLSLIPILSSMGTCLVCGLVGDWWCFSSILLGIVAGGLACLTIGSGELTFSHPKATPGVPAGDGILRTDDEVIVLLGQEDAVNVFTRGRFSLRFPPIVEAGFRSKSSFAAIGLCSGLLTAQFIVQLLLIPQGTLFGQLMFVTSLAVSWMYNMYVSSIDKEEVQTNILFRLLPALDRERAARMQRFKLPSWTATAVFALMRLQESGRMRNPRALLDELVPNDTPVWRAWKEKVVLRFAQGENNQRRVAAEQILDDDESRMLGVWIEDAEQVHHRWNTMRSGEMMKGRHYKYG